MTFLPGGHNFRDIGGYPTAGGKQVRRGLVFRSGMMTNCGAEDLQRLRETGLAVIFDLRSSGERKKYATPWREAGALDYRFDESAAATGDLYRLIAFGGSTAEETRRLMLGIYRDLAFHHAGAYRTILREIAAGRLPMVFHCAAGKDRTGALTAILLNFLGVAYDIVKADYVLSNDVIDLMSVVRRQREARASAPTALDAVPLEALVPLLRAEPEYLDVAFNEIAARCGTVAAYVRDVLQLSGEEQDLLRLRLLEDRG